MVSKNENSLKKIIKSTSILNQNLNRSYQKKLYSLKYTEIPKNIFSEKKVLNGPLKGILYPDFFSAGSTLYPKLLGSYECELHKVISSTIKENYTQIIDIGCAEGYYAIGLALACKTAVVHAFDINEKAIKYCSEMAELNNVSDRVFTHSKCDSDTLSSFNFSNKTFILSDCESFEKQLFTKENIHYFKNVDLLIEVHDFIDNSISGTLLQLFRNSHYVKILSSIDDFQKPFIVNYTELNNLSYDIKYQVLAEKRPCIMQWFFFKAAE